MSVRPVQLLSLLAASVLLAACASSGDAEPQPREAAPPPGQEMIPNALGEEYAEEEEDDDSGGFFSGLWSRLSGGGSADRPLTYQERMQERQGAGTRTRRDVEPRATGRETRDRQEREWDPAALDDRDQRIRELEMELAALEAGDDEGRGILGTLRGMVVPGASEEQRPRNFQEVQQERYQRTATTQQSEQRLRTGQREERIREIREELAALESEAWEQRLRNGTSLAAADGPRTRIGILLDGPDVQRLANAFSASAMDLPVRLLTDGDTRAAVRGAGCPADNPGACANSLRRDPGMRMLLEVRSDTDGQVAVRYHDLELGGEPQVRRLSPGSPTGRVSARALEELADTVLRAALEQSRPAPWFARPLEGSGDELWVINAGRDSGLGTGQQLRVHGPGRVVWGPAGRPAGWVRGNATGLVEVVELGDNDTALVRLLDGQGPGRESVLIPTAQ